MTLTLNPNRNHKPNPTRQLSPFSQALSLLTTPNLPDNLPLASNRLEEREPQRRHVGPDPGSPESVEAANPDAAAQEMPGLVPIGNFSRFNDKGRSRASWQTSLPSPAMVRG